jgi:hypothetical protein
MGQNCAKPCCGEPDDAPHVNYTMEVKNHSYGPTTFIPSGKTPSPFGKIGIKEFERRIKRLSF